MEGHEHLILRTIKLGPAESWSNGAGGGLTFLFPRIGDGRFTTDGCIQPVGPGDVFVVNASYEGVLSNANGHEMVFAVFSACLDHLFPLLASHEISVLQVVSNGIRQPMWFGAKDPVAQSVHKLIAETTPEPTLDHRGQLLRVAATLLSIQFKLAKSRHLEQMPMEDNLVQVFEELSVSDLLSLSVDELAVRCKCSRRHLSRLFQHYFQFSIGTLKMEVRLLKAVSLLRDPSAKVVNVSLECGFNHQGLFNTCFKKRFGMSPGQWRKTTSDAEKARSQSANPSGGCQRLANGLCPLSVSAKSCKSLVRNLARQALGASKPEPVEIKIFIDKAQTGKRRGASAKKSEPRLRKALPVRV